MREKLKPVGITLVVIAFLAFGFYRACLKTHTINTMSEFCEGFKGEDLFEKYDSAAIRYDYEAIRNDVVQQFHQGVIAKLTKENLGRELPESDNVVSELVRLKMLGVWREGVHLHMADQLTMPDKPEEADALFTLWRDEFQEAIKPKSGKYKDDTDQCIFGSINNLFEDLTLHGHDNRTAVIKLDYFVKKYE